LEDPDSGSSRNWGQSYSGNIGLNPGRGRKAVNKGGTLFTFIYRKRPFPRRPGPFNPLQRSWEIFSLLEIHGGPQGHRAKRLGPRVINRGKVLFPIWDSPNLSREKARFFKLGGNPPGVLIGARGKPPFGKASREENFLQKGDIRLRNPGQNFCGAPTFLLPWGARFL